MGTTMKNAVRPAIEFDTLEPRDNWFQSWFPFLRWIPTSSLKLKDAEEKFIDYVKVPSEGFYVNVGKITGEDECKIWTRKFQNPGMEDESKVPLVMIHGMGAGLAMFALNIDTLAQDRVVYAIDLPGFGRSSRPGFSSVFKIVRNFNPLFGMRASGPAGPRLMKRMRPDLMRKFEDLVGEENLQIVGDYPFHCNGQNPAGETAFSRVMNDFFWAKTPALPRLEQANNQVPITFLYGSDSWISRMKSEEDDPPGSSIPHSSVQFIEDAGHHVYADRAVLFNQAVRTALE